MLAKISAFKIKEMPSKFKAGTTWKLATVKFEGQGDEKYELQGFGTRVVEGLKEGQYLKGYFSTKTFNGVTTQTFNKITAEYVYDLLMDMKRGAATPGAAAPAASAGDPGPTPEGEDDSDDNW